MIINIQFYKLKNHIMQEAHLCKLLLKRYSDVIRDILPLWSNNISPEATEEADRKKKWANNVTEWTRNAFAETWILTCNWDKWKELVICSGMHWSYDHTWSPLWWWRGIKSSLSIRNPIIADPQEICVSKIFKCCIAITVLLL